MKLLLENWREYIAQEDSEQAETIEKLLRMEFDQAISLINALKTDESDNHLEDAYEMALGREYKDSKKELDYWMQELDHISLDKKSRKDFYDAEEKYRALEAKWEAMINYFAEKDKL
jgi:hypothetical protein